MRPPRLLCPACGSDALEAGTTSGRGTVVAHTVVEGSGVALVDLAGDDGLRLFAVDLLGDVTLETGMPVSVVESDGLLQLREAADTHA